MNDLEEKCTIMKAKEAHLTRQLFENMKKDYSQLECLNGLPRVVWHCVWKFLTLKPSEDNILNENRRDECMRDMPWPAEVDENPSCLWKTNLLFILCVSVYVAWKRN